MQSLMWEEFLGSNVDCYMEDSPRLLCTKITRGEGSCNLDEGKSFSVPVWFSTSRLVPYCFAQILQEKKGSREEKEPSLLLLILIEQDDSWFSGVL